MSFIKDENNNYKEPEYIIQHKQKFNKEPNIIGMFWNNPKKLIDGIIEAIDENKPYDEYKMLSKDEQKSFDKGELVF